MGGFRKGIERERERANNAANTLPKQVEKIRNQLRNKKNDAGQFVEFIRANQTTNLDDAEKQIQNTASMEESKPPSDLRKCIHDINLGTTELATPQSPCPTPPSTSKQENSPGIE